MILGNRIEVRFAPYTDPGLDEKVGRYRHREGWIMVAEGQTEQQTRDTVFHELLHVVAAFGDFRDETYDERLVGAMSPLLLHTLRDNAVLREYLFDG